MRTVSVSLGHRSYDILIGEDLLGKVAGVLDKHGVGKRIFVISNLTVFELFGQELVDSLSEAGLEVVHLLIPEGEKSKTLHAVENIYTYLIAQRADRKTTLAALGGGVTGDIVGFVAATFLRGVPYVQIPTTLLSQVDSSVGGKTGVNHQLGKNLIGAFYQPNLVCIDTNSLSTLPPREFQAGLYEVLKYGLIYDAEFFDYLEGHLDELKQKDPSILEAVISRCCEIKAEVTSIDETEEGLRRILNFGHTLGHALEAATQYEDFKHGEAVAYGMMAAATLSHREGNIDDETLERINSTILRIGPLPSVGDMPFSRLFDVIQRDKKRVDDRIVFVLLERIGKTVIRSGFEESLLSEVWERALSNTTA
jgi:3-dehydroquinate synthase